MERDSLTADVQDCYSYGVIQGTMLFPETAQIIDLGIPTEKSFPNYISTSRNPWDELRKVRRLRIDL